MLDMNALPDNKKPLHQNRPERKAAREQADQRYTSILERFTNLPREIILLVLEKLDTEELLALCGCDKVREIVSHYDLIRLRELQCFFSKKGFMEVKLGIGVRRGRGKSGFASEFDFLSQYAFDNLMIRKSVQGLPFQHWLPLPISRRHWNLVRKDAGIALAALAQNWDKRNGPAKASVIYQFMSDVVVQFSRTAEQHFGRDYNQSRSSLAHASEKAIESYFALFHLLLCLGIEDRQIIDDAHRMLRQFQEGNTSKSSCSNLGHLLVALLVSEQDMTEDLTFLIIRESITRNVVWMLDPKGADMAELSYLEPSPESDYRLYKTFQASKTSYRLLMFLNLFRKTVRPQGKPIQQVCDEAFEAHGVPPKGTTERLANEIRRIHAIDNFPHFLESMGITAMPSKQEFTTFLRDSVEDSMHAGYSKWPLNQSQLLRIRKDCEPLVEVAPGLLPSQVLPPKPKINFFPSRR